MEIKLWQALVVIISDINDRESVMADYVDRRESIPEELTISLNTLYDRRFRTIQKILNLPPETSCDVTYSRWNDFMDLIRSLGRAEK